MTMIAIFPESFPEGTSYRAVAGQRQSRGRTPGEALDTLTEQLSEQESGTLIVMQPMRPDQFFTEVQRQRLEELMDRWRRARDGHLTFAAEEQAELDALVAAEVEAATKRTRAMLRDVQQ
jgi:hypothetical protein